MKCSKIRKILPAYLDDELEVHIQRQVENHLKYCSLCRIELKALNRTNAMLDTWGDVQPSKDIVGDVMAQIKLEHSEGSLLQRAWHAFTNQRLQLARVAGILLLFAALLLGMKETYSPQSGLDRAGMDQLLDNRIPGITAQSGESESRDSLHYYTVKMVESFKRNYRRPNDMSDYEIHVYYDRQTDTIRLIGYCCERRRVIRSR